MKKRLRVMAFGRLKRKQAGRRHNLSLKGRVRVNKLGSNKGVQGTKIHGNYMEILKLSPFKK